MVTRTMYVFSFPVYALLDRRSTLSFVTPLAVNKFDWLPAILHEPFLVTISKGTTLELKEPIMNAL